MVTAGSNPARGDQEYRLERYFPPYLFRGRRPAVVEVPGQLHHGESVSLVCPQSREIKWVNLTRAGSTMHCLNTDQRLVDLPITSRLSSQLIVSVPGSPNLLRLLPAHRDRPAGVPSAGRWVRVS